MPIERKNLRELNQQIQNELPLETAKQPLRLNFFLPFGSALAGVAHGIYGYQEWMTKQLFPNSCDEETLLSYHAPLYLKNGQKEPTAATGPVLFTGNKNTLIAKGSLLNREDGIRFALVEDTVIQESGSCNAKVICLTPGIIGNTKENSKLQLETTLLGVNSQVLVQIPGLTGGDDLESISQLRHRVMRSRIAGADIGRDIDWEDWAMEVAGVTRAWAVPKAMGLGTTLVYFVRDEQTPIFPNEAEVHTVLTHLEATGQPNGEVFVVSPILKKQDFKIKLIPDSAATRENVKEALRVFLNGKASPVKKNKYGRTLMPPEGIVIYWSQLVEIIAGAVGEEAHILQEPTGDIVCDVGEYIQLGDIEWK